MEYDVNGICEGSKNKIHHIKVRTYFSNLYWLHVHNRIFPKATFSYVVTCSMKCFICFIASRFLSSSVFAHHPHWYVYFQILYNTTGFYKWKLKLTWSCKCITWKKITEHTCWSLGLLLTRLINFARAAIARLNKYWCM